MLVVDNGDAIRGIAEVATKLDFTVSGYVGTTATQLADGQLGISEADMYLSAADATVVTSITVVNTDTAARTFTLYLKPSAGTARAISPVSLDLGIGHCFLSDGQRSQVMDTTGQIINAWIVDDTPVDGELNHPISSNYMYDHVDAADPHTGYMLESLLDAKGDIITASADNTPAKLGVGADGTALTAASGEATGLVWSVVSAADFQRFTSSGTWTKPAGVTHVYIEVIGAGGGGGGGRGAAAGTVRGGGAAGGGGARTQKIVPASTCGATEAVTISAGGASGAGGSGANGSAGGVGGTSSFGSILRVYGGGGGSAGVVGNSTGAGGGGTAGAGGAPTAGLPRYTSTTTPGDALAGGGAAGGSLAVGNNAEYGGGGGGGGRDSAAHNGGGSLYGGPGAGGGGGLTSGNVENVGGAGGAPNSYTTGGGGSAGAVNGGAGGAGAAGADEFCGQGGGGGGSQDSGTGGVGGAGGAPGGGAGGGGGGTTIGGAGGVGGRGEVRVWSW